MLFFKKKTNNVKNNNDREIIEANASAMEPLFVLAKDEELKAEFKKIQEQIKYIIALPDSKAMDYDKKIKNAISDIKIELVKDKNDEKAVAKIQSLISDLKLLIAERKALV